MPIARSISCACARPGSMPHRISRKCFPGLLPPALAGPIRHDQQCRGFRLFPWLTDSNNSVRSRHLTLRYRYMESLNRNSSWDHGSRDDGLKDCASLSHFSRARRLPRLSRYADADNIKSWSDGVSGMPAFRGAECEALDHILGVGDDRGKHGNVSDSVPSFKEWFEMPRSLAKGTLMMGPRAPRTMSAERPSDGSFIDPVTNRRVYGQNTRVKSDQEKASSKNAPGQTRESAHQVAKFKPMSGDATDDPAKPHQDSRDDRSVLRSEPDVHPQPSAEAKTSYDDLNDYRKPFVVDDSLLSAYETKQKGRVRKAKPIPAKVEMRSDDAARQPKDLGKDGPVCRKEPHGRLESVVKELSAKRDSLHKYSQPFKIGSATSRLYADEGSKTSQNLAKDAPASANHYPTSSLQYSDSRRHSDTSHEGAKSVMYGQTREQAGPASDVFAGYSTHRPCSLSRGQGATDAKPAANHQAEVSSRAHANNHKATLERAKSEHELNWDATSKEAQDTLEQVKKKTERIVTGNYVRDFPEELSASGSTSHSASKSSISPKENRGDEIAVDTAVNPPSIDKEEAEMCSMDESFPKEESKPEQDVHGRPMRQAAKTTSPLSGPTQAEIDPYSKIAQGLQTSYAEELGNKGATSVFMKHYETKKVCGKPEAEACKDSQDGVLSYKIIAYDAASGSIRIADTTSGAREGHFAASPATVLPRLSHPSKYLPYFSRLQAQGYEMVSGGDDVLVFQKVRPEASEKATTAAEACQAQEAPVNPIDLMDRSVTGNFASPTGFVNHDAWADRCKRKPRPPLRTGGMFGTEVRPEDQKKQKKGGVGRRVATGTVLVVGLAYATGVFAEYYSTRGIRRAGSRAP